MRLALEILGALLALGVGVWLGLPGRYQQSADDIEEMMAQGGSHRRKARRVVTPLAWLQRRLEPSRTHHGGSRGRQRGSFKLESPEDD